VALLERGPIGDAVRRWFRHTHAAWMSSEIALTRTLLQLNTHPTSSGLSLPAVLEALHTGIAIRPLPLERISGWLVHSDLCMADGLELAAARCWRCHYLISNNPSLRQGAEAAGLVGIKIGT
jgi:hypothetical protein